MIHNERGHLKAYYEIIYRYYKTYVSELQRT